MGGDDEDEYPDFDPGPFIKAKRGSLQSYEAQAAQLFHKIEDRFGLKQAKRIFRSQLNLYEKLKLLGSPPKHERKRWEVLTRYYGMKPWRNKQALARELHDDKTFAERYGNTSVTTLETYIKRAVKDLESTNLGLMFAAGLGGPDKLKPRPKRKP